MVSANSSPKLAHMVRLQNILTYFGIRLQTDEAFQSTTKPNLAVLNHVSASVDNFYKNSQKIHEKKIAKKREKLEEAGAFEVRVFLHKFNFDTSIRLVDILHDLQGAFISLIYPLYMRLSYDQSFDAFLDRMHYPLKKATPATFLLRFGPFFDHQFSMALDELYKENLMSSPEAKKTLEIVREKLAISPDLNKICENATWENIDKEINSVLDQKIKEFQSLLAN